MPEAPASAAAASTAASAAAAAAAAAAARARLLAVLLGVCWGLNWIAVRVALHEIRPWSLRCIGMGLGTVTLLAWAALRGRPLRIAPGAPRRRLALAGVLNVAAFGVFTAFAQLAGSTSRVTMVTYTMPIWSVLFARIALGERLDGWRLASLALAAAGLAVLIGPMAAAGATAGMGWALAAALAWAAGTVYLKHARIEADPVAIAAWQLAAGFVAVALGALLLEGPPRGWPADARTWAAVSYHVLLGMALPYLLWFAIVERLPASSAALGTLLVPVVAVLGAVLLLGERPTPVDALGFALILAAAAAVLLRGAPAPPARPTGDPA
ncbi:MAG: DMT family transporter [Burkholderiales bacterium]|nr:DMT family transporter [Burkholderiales bacterium]